MWVSLLRSELRLKRAFDRLEILYKENEALYEKNNSYSKLCANYETLSVIGYLIIKTCHTA